MANEPIRDPQNTSPAGHPRGCLPAKGDCWLAQLIFVWCVALIWIVFIVLSVLNLLRLIL